MVIRAVSGGRKGCLSSLQVSLAHQEEWNFLLFSVSNIISGQSIFHGKLATVWQYCFWSQEIGNLEAM